MSGPSILLALAALVASAAPALAAPKQLYNKTVVINWSESVTERAADGKVTTPTINSVRMVYISGAGRLFVKGSRNINMRNFQGGNAREVGPENTGSNGSLNFQGDQLVGTAVFQGGARRLSANFTPDFSSCTAAVVYGKSGGALTKWTGFDGVVREIVAVNIGSVSCAIRDGNAVAS